MNKTKIKDLNRINLEKQLGFKLLRRNFNSENFIKDDYILNNLKKLEKDKFGIIKNKLIKLLKNDSKHELYWAVLGYLYIIEKKFERSKKCFFMCLKLDNRNINNWIDLANIYKLLDNNKFNNFILSNLNSLTNNKIANIEKYIHDNINKLGVTSKYYSITNLDNNLVSFNKSKNKKNILFINPPIEEPVLYSTSNYLLKKIRKLNFFLMRNEMEIYDINCINKNYPYSLPLGLLRVANQKLIEGNNIYFIDCFASLPKTFPNSYVRASNSKIKKSFSFTKKWEIKYIHLGLKYNEFKSIIKKIRNIDEIYVGCTFTYHNESAHKIISICRKIFPDKKIVFGGIYPTLAPIEAKKSKADEIYIGKYPISNDSLNYNILGYVPYYSLIKGTSGCPHNCSYCAVHKLEGNKFCFRNPNEVFDEIYMLYNNHNISEIAIWDSNLLVNYPNYLKILLNSIKLNINNPIITAPEGLDYRLINIGLAKDLKDSGFKTIYLALENFDVNFSKNKLNRVNNLIKFKNAVNNLKKVGFKGKNIGIFIIVGLPNQSIKNIVENIKFVWSLDCNVVIFPFTPIPGTKMYEENYNFLKNKKFKDLHPILFSFVNNEKNLNFFINIALLNYLNRLNLSQKDHFKILFKDLEKLI